MKKIVFFCFNLIFGANILVAQVQSPPPVEWKHDHHFPHLPIDSTGAIIPITGGTDDYSGEDWWFSVKKTYDTLGVHNGYVACGYSNFEDHDTLPTTPWLYDEVSGGQGGVVQDILDSVEVTECSQFHYFPNYPKGTTMQTIGRYNLSGNMMWCRVVNRGAFENVVQSNDGLHFIATGYTNAIKDRKAYQWSGGEFLAYNPDGSVTNTFEGWDTAGYTGRAININMVSLDALTGDIEWNYLYGSDDYNVDPEAAFKCRGKGRAIASGSGLGSSATYRIAGNVRAYDSTGVSIKRSMAVMEIDEDGILQWFDTPLDSEGVHTNALDIIRNELGHNEYYVTGHQYLTVNETLTSTSNSKIKLLCYSENGSLKWNEDIDNSIDSAINEIGNGTNQHEYNGGWGITIDSDSNLLLAAFINTRYDPLTGHSSNGTGRVYTINPDTSVFTGIASSANPISVGYFGAFDLRLGITSTLDGGFAFISSKRRPTAWNYSSFTSAFPSLPIPGHLANGGPCGNSSYNFDSWDSDSYISKYQKDSTGNWELRWENQIDSDNPRAVYPGDLKKQECVYKILENSDGSLVFTGNTSDNHDDYYLVKIKADCGNPLLITAATISNCYGDSNAVAFASANGGTAPYTYNWPGSITGDTVSNLPSGNHIITVADAAGCEAIALLEIEEPDTVLYISSSTITNLLCTNDSNGSITIVAAGGESPYSYHWSNGDTTNSIDSLVAGVYFLTLTDSLGCGLVDTFTVSSPSLLSIIAAVSSDTVCANDTVSLTSTPSGGTSPYTYIWSNTATAQNQTGVTVSASTTYVITLTDDNGCSALDSVSVYASPAPSINFTSVEVWAQAKDFPLLHAEPEGGVYSGAGVYSYLGDYWFKPSVCTSLSYCNQPITYTYTDSIGCSNTITDTFIVYHDCQGVNTTAMPPTISTTTGYGDIQYPLALASNNEAQIADLVHNQDYDLFFAGSYKGKTQIGHRIFKSVANSTDIVVGMFDGDNTGTNAGCGLVWLETYGGDGEDFGHAVEVENPLNNGYVYLAGEITEGYDFDGNVPNVYTSTEKGFVIALDPTTYYTTWQWGSIVGANDLAVSSINDIALTPGGELGAVGFARYSTNNLTFAGNTYTGGLLDDPFIGVYDAFGNEVRSAVIPDNDDGAYNAVENAGQDFIAVGNSKDLFGNTLTGVMPYGFGNLTYASTGFEHALFSRFAAPYTTLEVNLVGNAYDNSAEAIHADPNGGDYYVTGYYKEVIDFGCGSMASIMTGSSYTQDAFVLRMDANGNCLSQQTIGDLGDDECQAVYYSPSNWLFVGVGLDPGFGSEDEVLFELDPVSLNVNSAQVLINGVPSANLITSLSTNIGWGTPVGAVIAGGYFNGTISLNNTINAAGSNQDGFLARIAYNSSYFAAFKYDEKDTKVELNGLALYPNPSTDILNIALEFGAKVSIYDATGRLVYSAGLNEGITEINVSKWSRGIYHVISQHGSDIQSGKLVLQ